MARRKIADAHLLPPAAQAWYGRAPMLRPVSIAIFAAALAVGTVGCDKPEARTALSYTANAERAYEEAMKEFTSHNWIESQALFREVKRKYHYSKYAKLAELR